MMQGRIPLTIGLCSLVSARLTAPPHFIAQGVGVFAKNACTDGKHGVKETFR
jgi:hypothetical protein